MKSSAIWIAVAAAAGVTALAIPLWTWVYRRRGWVDAPGPRKIHGDPTPLSGGVAVATGLIFGLAIIGSLKPDSSLFSNRGWFALGGGLAILFLGWWDDARDLRPRSKFCGQLAVSLMVASLVVRPPVLGEWPLLQVILSAFLFIALINAVNFLDNMNGLCAGLGLIAGAQCGLLASLRGDFWSSVVGASLAGACAGFLPYNFPRGRVFLGDSGSHWIGYWMGILVLQSWAGLAREQSGRQAWWAGLMALGLLAVPAVDLVQVTVTRVRQGRPIYVGDNQHLSHRLARTRLGRTGAVVLLWLLAGFGGMLVILWTWTTAGP